MAWVREDDGELLDAKVGRLSDREYRELHALRQYVAREHPGAGGIFAADELPAALYSTPKGGASVSRRALDRFLTVGLVRSVRSYSEAELVELEEEEHAGRARLASAEAAAAIREHADDVVEMLRFNRWEAYNGGRDRTRATRQARYRSKRDIGSAEPESGESDGVAYGVREPSPTPSVRARSRPVPSPGVSPSTSTTGRGEGLNPGKELATARLLALVGDVDATKLDYIRGASARLPESKLVGIAEMATAARTRDRVGYVIGALKRELGGA